MSYSTEQRSPYCRDKDKVENMRELPNTLPQGRNKSQAVETYTSQEVQALG